MDWPSEMCIFTQLGYSCSIVERLSNTFCPSSPLFLSPFQIFFHILPVAEVSRSSWIMPGIRCKGGLCHNHAGPKHQPVHQLHCTRPPTASSGTPILQRLVLHRPAPARCCSAAFTRATDRSPSHKQGLALVDLINTLNQNQNTSISKQSNIEAQ